MKSESLPISNIDDLTSALDDLDKVRTIWPYATLLFTKAGKCGETEGQRRAKIDEFISTRCHHPLTWLVRTVTKQKTLIVEHDDLCLPTSFEIRKSKVRDIIDWSSGSVSQGGVYINAMMKDAKKCWDKYKFEVEKKEENKTDPHPPSYAELASRIIDSITIPPGRVRSFREIYRGIQKYRRKQHNA